MDEKTELVYCPKCTRQLEVPISYIGEKGECPYCQEKFIIARPKTQKLPKSKLHVCFLAISFFVLGGMGIGAIRGAYLHNRDKEIKREIRVLESFNTELFDNLQESGIQQLTTDSHYLWLTNEDRHKEFKGIIQTAKRICEKGCSESKGRKLLLQASKDPRVREIAKHYESVESIMECYVKIFDQMIYMQQIRLKPIDDADRKVVADVVGRFKSIEALSAHIEDENEKYKQAFRELEKKLILLDKSQTEGNGQ